MMGHYKAYWSIPHKLIVFALHRHGVFIERYYNGIFSQSFSESATRAWHRHQWGNFADHILSIIIYWAGMNIILEYLIQSQDP